VALEGLQPYLSAIIMMLLDHALPPVALGLLVTRVRKGFDNCQENSTSRPQRLPLPAPVALAIIALLERLIPTIEWDVRDPRLLLLIAATTSIASYMFFNRGNCSACALMEDIATDDTNITRLLQHEKWNKTLNEGHMNAMQVPYNRGPKNRSDARNIL